MFVSTGISSIPISFFPNFLCMHCDIQGIHMVVSIGVKKTICNEDKHETVLNVKLKALGLLTGMRIYMFI